MDTLSKFLAPAILLLLTVAFGIAAAAHIAALPVVVLLGSIALLRIRIHFSALIGLGAAVANLVVEDSTGKSVGELCPGIRAFLV